MIVSIKVILLSLCFITCNPYSISLIRFILSCVIKLQKQTVTNKSNKKIGFLNECLECSTNLFLTCLNHPCSIKISSFINNTIYDHLLINYIKELLLLHRKKPTKVLSRCSSSLFLSLFQYLYQINHHLLYPVAI